MPMRRAWQLRCCQHTNNVTKRIALPTCDLVYEMKLREANKDNKRTSCLEAGDLGEVRRC